MDLDLSALPWLLEVDFRPRNGSATCCSSTGGDLASPGDGGWPLPAAGGRRLAHASRPSDQTCPLQSGQKTKNSGLARIRSSSPPQCQEGEPANDDKWGRRPRNSML